MGFREHLEEITKRVEGAVGCTLMGSDGIEIDGHVAEGAELDVKALLVEISGILRSARDAAEANAAGAVTEMALATERVLAVVRVLSPEFFLVAVLQPDGNYGKARFLLRVNGPKLLAEL